MSLTRVLPLAVATLPSVVALASDVTAPIVTTPATATSCTSLREVATPFDWPSRWTSLAPVVLPNEPTGSTWLCCTEPVAEVRSSYAVAVIVEPGTWSLVTVRVPVLL